MRVDVVIIGASTAGVYSACLLAEAGKNVVLFDRAAEGQFDRRTYIVTKGLERVMPEFDQGLILNQINSMQVEALGVTAEIQLSNPDLVVERSQIQQSLIDRAHHAGVSLQWNCRYIGIEKRDGEPGVMIQREDSLDWVATRVLVGADGVSSEVRKSAELSPVPAEPLLQAEITLPKDWDRQVTKVWFETNDTPYFYWLIPESNQKGVVGLIAQHGSDIGKLLNDFLERYQFQSVEYQSGRAALHDPALVNWSEQKGIQIYLVGDAAGQVKVTTVGGTVTGFRGAQAVVKSILNDVQYQTTNMALKRELDLHVFIRRLLERMNNQGYQKMIRAISPAVQNFLGKYDRDAMRGQFWKLPFIQPQFIPLGLKLLFSRRKHLPS